MTFYKVIKILATLLLIYQGLYYAINQPGPMSSFGAVIHGVAFFAIWFSEERKKS